VPTVPFSLFFPCFLSPCDEELRTVLASPSEFGSGFCVVFLLLFVYSSFTIPSLSGFFLFAPLSFSSSPSLSFFLFSRCILVLLCIFAFFFSVFLLPVTFLLVTFRSLAFIAKEQCCFFQPLITGVMVAVGVR